VLRLLGLALWMAAAHGIGALLDLFRPRAAREARRAARRARSAERLVALLGSLRGLYTKAGQFASVRYDVLPAEVSRALETLRDRVPPLPFEVVRGVVEEELGAPLERLFAEFAPEPLGAASIAQVHRARLPGGEDVAVKVQYPWLEAALPRDLALARAVVGAWSFARGRRSPDRGRLLREFEAGLREEFDFLREAAVAREIAANLAGDPQIVVPRVFPELTRRRVLTMSHHAGVAITDRSGLDRLGARPRDALEVLARAYAKQVFVDGLFHADPHPGNLFVLDEPTAAVRPRVLFVDFGLSRRLDPELRRELRTGILALLGGDLDGFLAGMARMHMIAPGAEPGVRAAVESMFARIRGTGAPLGLAGAQVLALKDEAKALLQETPGLELPNDLLLYAKTLSYLFALGEVLDPEVDLLRLSTPYLLRFLAERDAAPRAG
jgi:predicted unusual protein kinase regulating ubiquinone biosynthesis (AarF/ABC1/UbiB family)